MITNRYLNGDPFPWLLEEKDQEVRYLTLRDMAAEERGPDDAEKARASIYRSPRVGAILGSAAGGVLGDTRHFDLLYRGTMWYFAEAVTRGLDKRDPLIASTAGFLCSKCRTETGGFIMNWKPPLAVACRTGDMVRYLIEAGFDDENVDRGIDWIVRHQRHDGGWLHCPLAGSMDMAALLLLRKAGGGLYREEDTSVPSCIYATAACLRALTAREGTRKMMNSEVGKAADFFLRGNMFIDGDKGKIPLCDAARRVHVTELGYPVLSQYDVLYGLLAVAEAGFLKDPRTGESFNAIIEKQNPDGSWNLENISAGMLFAGKKNPHRGKRNKWVTLNALRLMQVSE